MGSFTYLKQIVSLYGNFSFKALKLTEVKLDSDEDLQRKYEKCNTNSMRNDCFLPVLG